ncbi:MAG TPA: hypothetical protein VE685_25585, partial [Thermoanaerobaculia bacterium]|nr:hypothetical protein [Thermoanaerobaculia bacterium]
MKLKHLLAIGLLSLVPALGNAAEQANAPTATGETGLFTILTGDTLPRGGWSFGLYYNNWDRVLDLDGLDVEEESVDWNRLSASVGYGITDRWELSLAVPYDDYDFDFRGFDADASGLGNAILGTKFRLLGNAGDPTTLALNLFAELPTGDDDVASDDAGFGAGLGWRVNKWAFDVKYRDPGDPFGEELKGGIGYVGQVSERFDWITELVGTFYSGDDDFNFDDDDDDNTGFAPFDDSYDLTTGGRLWLGADGNWAFNFALRTNLASLGDIDEHCPIGGLLGLTYFPRFFERPAPPPPPPPP